jgi:hypothetical protein
MQYQQTPQTLADIWKGPVGAFIPSMNLFDQQGQRDQITQADQTRQLDYNYNADPMRLQSLALGNQTTEAQLPGIAAQSSMQQRKDRMGADTYDQEVKKLMSQYKAEEMAGWVKEMQGLAEFAGVHGNAAVASPFGAQARAREAFDKAGHGKFWNPEWDKMDVKAFSGTLKKFQSDVMESSAGYQKALDSITAKTESAEKIAAERNKTELEKERLRGDFKASLAKLKAEAGAGGGKTLEKGATDLFAAARVETDPEKRQMLIVAAQELLQQKAYLNAASAGVTQSGAVDMNNISKPGGGITARGAVPVPAPPPVSMGASAPAAAPKPQFEDGKVYQDAQGNKARFVNGQWVPM